MSFRAKDDNNQHKTFPQLQLPFYNLEENVHYSLQKLERKNKTESFNVTGAFMTNWDPLDEGVECSINKDREDAKHVCYILGIPFHEVNFVKHYWNDVFQEVILGYEQGLTPNPDILCNRHIKFSRFAHWALNTLKADAIATGHYATTSLGDFLDNPRQGVLHESEREDVALLRPRDLVKDQTFWLSQVPGSSLRRCMFPLGSLLKPEVKRIAREIGLEKVANRKESMGMCFIGKRRFKNFIDSYISPRKGVFRLLESGEIVGEHNGIHHYTLGQRCGRGGSIAHYITHLDPNTQDIFLVPTNSHPALYMRTIYTMSPNWLNPSTERLLPSSSSPPLQVLFQWQNKWRAIPCHVTQRIGEAGLMVYLDEPMRCVAPGQYAVFYRDERECLGGAKIENVESLWEKNLREPVNWNIKNYENHYT